MQSHTNGGDDFDLSGGQIKQQRRVFDIDSSSMVSLVQPQINNNNDNNNEVQQQNHNNNNELQQRISLQPPQLQQAIYLSRNIIIIKPQLHGGFIKSIDYRLLLKQMEEVQQEQQQQQQQQGSIVFSMIQKLHISSFGLDQADLPVESRFTNPGPIQQLHISQQTELDQLNSQDTSAFSKSALSAHIKRKSALQKQIEVKQQILYNVYQRSMYSISQQDLDAYLGGSHASFTFQCRLNTQHKLTQKYPIFLKGISDDTRSGVQLCSSCIQNLFQFPITHAAINMVINFFNTFQTMDTNSLKLLDTTLVKSKDDAIDLFCSECTRSTAFTPSSILASHKKMQCQWCASNNIHRSPAKIESDLTELAKINHITLVGYERHLISFRCNNPNCQKEFTRTKVSSIILCPYCSRSSRSSHGEKLMYATLDTIFDGVEEFTWQREVRFAPLGLLRFDVVVYLNDNIFIGFEYHGIQHYQVSGSYVRTEEELHERQAVDEKKRDFFVNTLGKKLITIAYFKSGAGTSMINYVAKSMLDPLLQLVKRELELKPTSDVLRSLQERIAEYQLDLNVPCLPKIGKSRFFITHIHGYDPNNSLINGMLFSNISSLLFHI